MPEDAKILRFPAREEHLTCAEAMVEARRYVDALSDGVSAEKRSRIVERPDVLLATLCVLREHLDRNALVVLAESESLYRSVTASSPRLGAFDEADYFAGDTALIAATACRVLGRRTDSEMWLERAEAGFRNTVNPTPLFASVAYQRLALRCESARYEEVLELAPMLAVTFHRLDMMVERAKCVFLEGLALKQSGSHEASISRFEQLKQGALVERDPALVGLALVNIADVHVMEGRDDEASDAYTEALPLLKRGNRPAALAHLKGVIGETLRRQGRLQPAIEAFRSSVEDYAQLQMSTWVVYVRLALAETLLAANKPREAEWQILASLPTINDEKMVPEGFAAVAILGESVRQRKTDPRALRELREYLQAKN